MTQRTPSLLVVLVLSVGLAGATSAAADDRGHAETRTILQSELSGSALEDYRIGRALFEGADFVAAFAKFESAYARSKNVRLLWNMAACKKNSHQYAATEALLKQYLLDGATKLSSESIGKAEALLQTLSQLLGRVNVRGADGLARVTIDERELTNEELTAPLRLEIGEHTISATMPGRRDFTRRFALAAAEDLDLRIELVPLSARLSVVADGDAEIWLDGRFVAKGRLDREVSPGTHALKLSAASRKPYASSVELEPGATRTLQITLERTQAPVWPWVAGAVVVAAGLATGAYFLFRRDDVVASPSGSLPPNAIQLP